MPLASGSDEAHEVTKAGNGEVLIVAGVHDMHQ